MLRDRHADDDKRSNIGKLRRKYGWISKAAQKKGLNRRFPNIGITVAIFIGSAQISSDSFHRTYQRKFTDQERRRLTLLSTLVSCIIATVQPVIVLIFLVGLEPFSDPINLLNLMLGDVKVSVLVIVAVVLVALNYGVLHLSYGHFANKRFDALVKKGKYQANA